MKAAVLQQTHHPLVIEQRELPDVSEGQVLIRLHAAALNRRDYWITQGLYPGIRTGVIQGSDGAGVVEAVGEGVDSDWIGRQVIINPGLEWGENEQFQSEQFHILGMPSDGTFAESICVPASAVFEKPAHLNWHHAAALPLAGVTAFRAVSRAEVKGDSLVLINGIGGGVALLAMQFCMALGARVLVTSSSETKLQRALEMGAAGAYLYCQDDWVKQVLGDHGMVDAIIDGAGGTGYRNLLQLAGPGGRIVNYGATAGPADRVDLFKVFWKQLKLIGSTMGSPADFEQMLLLVREAKIEPIVDSVFSLEDVNLALARLAESTQFGKVVIEINGINS